MAQFGLSHAVLSLCDGGELGGFLAITNYNFDCFVVGVVVTVVL